jgi:hypothetical protein
MPLRMRRSVRLAKGVRLNLGKRGASLSVRNGPITTNIGRKGTRHTISARGTGLSYSTKRSGCAGCLIPIVGATAALGALLATIL